MDHFKGFMKIFILSTLLIILCQIPYHSAAKTAQQTVIEDLIDIKDFKKLLRTKNNVLICYVESLKKGGGIVKVFREAAPQVKGQGTMVLIDCNADGKKLCKKLKVAPSTYLLKHYKDGEFHKDYDRKETVSSILNFMKDPTGDLPWEEDTAAENIVHIADAQSLSKFLRREQGGVMIMFYAPWCGFCKQLKPEYSAAALELKGHSILAAIDVNRPQNAVLRTQYNITGFPTLLYFDGGVMKLNYEGDNNKDSLVQFMKDPRAAPSKPVEQDWAETDTAVTHLTDDTFDPVLDQSESTLVMFYAPWCGHCKKMKPEYEKAAERMKKEAVSGVLAAVDATKYKAVGQRFKITGYPTVKYFKKGHFEFDVSLRDESKIVEFMKNPKQPPPPPPPEVPWSEQPSEVVHLTTETFKPFLKKKKHVLVMFYAPWCGHCKQAKPEYTSAAEQFKDDSKVELAAVDCTVEASVCSAYGVKGYPTIKYFNYLNREPPLDYNGGRTRSDFVKFMRQYTTATATATESKSNDPSSSSSSGDDWGLTDPSVLLHLTTANFQSKLLEHQEVLVFFHAEWCGHCRKLKRPYGKAAEELKAAGVPCRLAAVDVKVNSELSDQQGIAGLPSLKYYRKGEFVSQYSGPRTSQGIVEFVKSPPTTASVRSKEEL